MQLYLTIVMHANGIVGLINLFAFIWFGVGSLFWFACINAMSVYICYILREYHDRDSTRSN
jgi:hypothetical protein